MTALKSATVPACLLVVAFCLGVDAQATADHFSAGRVVALADIHGEYGPAVSMLTRAQVLDSTHAWAAGGTHLVIVGDLLDRGPGSRALMDLLMRLEGEALTAGGRVHVLLGNHEVMNLIGDLRYVSSEEFAAFASDESPEMRNAAYADWISRKAVAASSPPDRTAFDAAYPAGFFAHRAAFGPGGVYGRWLLGKPVLVVINNTAFVHAGLSARFTSAAVTVINDRATRQLRRYLTALSRLIEARIILATDRYFEHAEIARAYLDASAGQPSIEELETRRAAQAVIDEQNSMLLASDGPVWYRGDAGCSGIIEQPRVDTALGALMANRLVIGHTPTRSGRVVTRLNDRVIQLDTGFGANPAGRSMAVLLLEKDEARVLYANEQEWVTPAAEQPAVGASPQRAGLAGIERVLAGQPVAVRKQLADGSTIVDVGQNSNLVQARFWPATRRKKGVFMPVAAYRLDRLLELDMVLPAVVRIVDGRPGSLQYFPKVLIPDRERSLNDQRTEAWCPLNDQFSAMYIFDALIHNDGRSRETMLYIGGEWRLLLLGPAAAFASRVDWPRYLRRENLTPNTEWRRRLEKLDLQRLSDSLGDVLDRSQIQSIIKRRDRLLRIAEHE